MIGIERTKPRPVIGITTGSLAARPPRPAGVRQNLSYARAVAAAGGAPLLIPLLEDRDALAAIFERLDGLLLPGGGDVAPACYGEETRLDCRVEGVDALLDEVELTLARWALEDCCTLFAICRGLQVLNVAAGGTLVQDIATQVPQSLPHQQPDARTELVHAVRVEPSSYLADVLGAPEVQVNSIHHQAIARLAPGLRAVAWAPDGVCEAVEVEEHPFAVGVQWHPEELVPGHGPSARLFAAFIEECPVRSSYG